MSAWMSEELTRMEAMVQLAPTRRDGTLRKPVTIWVVRVGDDLYVRSWRGRTTSWFCGTQDRHEGRIWTGGVEQDAIFVEVDADDVHDAIDAAYRTKYHRYATTYVNPVVSPQARGATLKLVPRRGSS